MAYGKLASFLIPFIAYLCLTPFLLAEPPSCPTLETILKRQKLVVGTYNDEPYFGSLNPQTYELEGFDIDLARALAQEILGDPNKVEFVIVTSNNRLSFLQQGKIDMIIAGMSITKERQKIIDFSDIYYMAGQSLLVKAESSYREPEDLKRKKIGVIMGSTNTLNIKKILPQTTIVEFDTLTTALEALQKEQVQALSIDDVMLLGLQKNAKRFMDAYRFIGGEISWESYGIAVRKGCPELLNVINQALRSIKKNGEWQKIYDKNIKRISNISAGPPV